MTYREIENKKVGDRYVVDHMQIDYRSYIVEMCEFKIIEVGENVMKIETCKASTFWLKLDWKVEIIEKLKPANLHIP